MGTIAVPVMPYIGEYKGSTNVVLSLLDMGPPELLRLSDRPKPPVDKDGKRIVLPDGTEEGIRYQKLELQMVNTSISALANLGFGAFLNTNISSNCFCSLMDLMITTEIDATIDPKSFIVKARFGLGFRMAIIAYGIDSKLSSDFSGLAASAKLKMGSTSFQIISVGGGLGVIGAAQPLITNLSGDFTVETLESIGFVQAELANLFLNKNKTMTPELVGVDLDLDRMALAYSGDKTSHYMDVMRSQHYALQRATRNNTVTEAVKNLKADTKFVDVKEDIVRDFYARILGLSGDQRPDQDPLRSQLKLMLEAGT